MIMTRQQREDAAKVLKALAHPIRIGVILALQDRPMCFSDLMKDLECSQSMMSQQIRILEEKSLIVTRKQGVCKICELRNPDVLKMLGCISHHVVAFR